MSRKTSRNAARSARKVQRERAAGSSAPSKSVLSKMALGSIAVAVSVALHAQDASSTAGTDNAKTPREISKAKSQAGKRLGNPATRRLASSTALPADGAGLLVQAAPTSGQSVPTPPTSATQLQEIVVTGIRGSLARALQIKKISLGVVDAISAE